MLNDRFAKIVPAEFALITIIMCTTLIHMALKSSNVVSYIQDIMIVASTLAPLFYYCWFGNEIKLKVLLVTAFNFISLQKEENVYIRKYTTFIIFILFLSIEPPIIK